MLISGKRNENHPRYGLIWMSPVAFFFFNPRFNPSLQTIPNNTWSNHIKYVYIHHLCAYMIINIYIYILYIYIYKYTVYIYIYIYIYKYCIYILYIYIYYIYIWIQRCQVVFSFCFPCMFTYPTFETPVLAWSFLSQSGLPGEIVGLKSSNATEIK